MIWGVTYLRLVVYPSYHSQSDDAMFLTLEKKGERYLVPT